ncbi:MAG TPA: NfeD family protein [Balneolaceae bacterium]|nr:NfeD family protein [Balneolaceae bacterium]
MNESLLTWIFAGGGLFLMILEAFIPGGVAFFLGLSGLLVALIRYIGLIASPGISVAIWLICSLGLTIAFRPFLQKYWGGESFFKLADEDYEAMDQIVDVIEPIGALDNSGRIRFRGSSWKARSEEGTIPAGTKARIKYRDNLTWVVEPVDELEEGEGT